jgi:hypothetical protein
LKRTRGKGIRIPPFAISNIDLVYVTTYEDIKTTPLDEQYQMIETMDRLLIEASNSFSLPHSKLHDTGRLKEV